MVYWKPLAVLKRLSRLFSNAKIGKPEIFVCLADSLWGSFLSVISR